MSDLLVFPTARTTCIHETFTWRDIRLSVCPIDESVEWLEDGDELDGSEAMAILFGDFDLVGALDAVGAPGATTLVYSPGRNGIARLRSFPAHRWIEGSPGLFFTHDDTHLLLSPTDERLTENLTR